ncbi:MAG: tetratricopeptide repeat protein, partial [Roseiflexaceae bacterium]|nr:tetratricopeptide repeat protein [Roseiflexaceae bacterium]
MAIISLQSAYDQTRQWIESNEHERAIGLAHHILSHYPNNLEAYRILGEAHLASRQLDKAQESFERVLRSDPENIQAHVGLGITYERKGNLERAVPEFEQAWEIKPDVPELRSQLLRVYSDAWGSEHATLRLSRAGLARLYAKGHMLPKAITEFRQVLADQPTRLDARIGLAEALWRDGQEQEAISLCREILAKQPDALKANLILGYLLLAQGSPEGQRPWDAATAIDPQMIVASAMFETLPSQAASEPSLPAWDADAWEQAQRLARQPVVAATRPIPVAAPELARSATPAFGGDDDFLAVLLSGGSSAAAASASSIAPERLAQPSNSFDASYNASSSFAPADQTADDELTPFSLADLGLSDDEIDAIGQPQPGDTVPFSLDDFGLDDQPVQLRDVQVPAAPAPDADEPALTPFSLADLGLSDDEIASLDGTSAPAPAPDTDEPAFTPFSLADLGLSDDEIASLDSTSAPAPAPDADEPAFTPFSLADLGLSDDE